MKIKDLKDDETVYVLLDEKDEFVITMAHKEESNALKNKEKTIKLFPWREVNVIKTVASDLPRDMKFEDWKTERLRKKMEEQDEPNPVILRYVIIIMIWSMLSSSPFFSKLFNY